ncbi:MAG: isochorismatase family protein [Opitutaceae bacterium]|nr:isochorismatase family protein [Opitutaceae bacterium]
MVDVDILDLLLHRAQFVNVYHLLLAGIETPICVYQTALHAQDNELDVTILSDCTTGRRPEDCYVVLESLARAECHVLPAETVFYSMLGSSLNPRFPHFTRIVKRYTGEGAIDGTPTPAPEPEPRADGEERHGDRRGGRHGERHERRQGERQHERREAAATRDESPADSDEPTDDLRAEDGISESEANQPSYEEATAEHSEIEDAPAAHDGPVTAREPASSAAEVEGESDQDDDGEPSDTEGAAEGDEGAPKKKRGRRRRGGARRRRARERAAAAAGPEGGSSGQAPADTSPAPAESAPPPPNAPDPAG